VLQKLIDVTLILLALRLQGHNTPLIQLHFP